jgi:hypothetical protein
MPRQIQPKVEVELTTLKLKLPAELVRRVDEYAKFLGGPTDRLHVITQAIEIALESDPKFRKARGTAALELAKPAAKTPAKTPTSVPA